MAAVCCSACRTCATTNLLALAAGAGLGAVSAVARFGKRLAGRERSTVRQGCELVPETVLAVAARRGAHHETALEPLRVTPSA